MEKDEMDRIYKEAEHAYFLDQFYDDLEDVEWNEFFFQSTWQYLTSRKLGRELSERFSRFIGRTTEVDVTLRAFEKAADRCSKMFKLFGKIFGRLACPQKTE